MNETSTPVTPEPTERYKTIIVVLILITSVITAIIATLQADANIRANQANRDSQYYAILVSGELYRSGLQSTYDLNTASKVISESLTSLIMQYTALQGELSGDPAGIAFNNLEAMAAQARADKLISFSILFSDPRYAPETEDGSPDTETYIADLNAQAIELVRKQNAAADEYHRWSSKADTYVSVLTIMALAFLLFGLAQALTGRTRLIFAIFGMVILFGASVWAVLILLS